MCASAKTLKSIVIAAEEQKSVGGKLKILHTDCSVGDNHEKQHSLSCLHTIAITLLTLHSITLSDVHFSSIKGVKLG